MPGWIQWVVLVLAATIVSAVQAREYYRWVDGDGVVHFSQEAPPTDARQLKKILIEDPQSGTDSGADPFNIEATAKRTQAQREELAEQRTRAREHRRELDRIAAQQQVVHYQQVGNYLPGWYARPPLRPRPPIARPPLRPTPEPYETVPFRPPGRASQR